MISFDPVEGRGVKLLRIISVEGKPSENVQPKDLRDMRSVRWSASGRALYISTGTRLGRDLWRVDFKGRSKPVWEHRRGDWIAGIPSPDGRHMAIQSSEKTANVLDDGEFLDYSLRAILGTASEVDMVVPIKLDQTCSFRRKSALSA